MAKIVTSEGNPSFIQTGVPTEVIPNPPKRMGRKIEGITDDWNYRKNNRWESTFNVNAPEDSHGYLPFSANVYRLMERKESPLVDPVVSNTGDKPMEFNFVNTRTGYGPQQNKFGVTGTGHAKEVISQASRRFVGALQKFNPPLMTYSAEEPSRASLYERLTRNLSVDNYKGYRLKIPGDDRATFAAIRQDHIGKLTPAFQARGIGLTSLAPEDNAPTTG